jgi:hypothetical protein
MAVHPLRPAHPNPGAASAWFRSMALTISASNGLVSRMQRGVALTKLASTWILLPATNLTSTHCCTTSAKKR